MGNNKSANKHTGTLYRKRRATDGATAPTTERAEAPAQSLATLRNSQASPAERGQAALELQRAIGNAEVGRVLHRTIRRQAEVASSPMNREALLQACDTAITTANWMQAALYLNGLNEQDIHFEFKKHRISPPKIQEIHGAAVRSQALSPWSQIARLTKPLRNLSAEATAEIEVLILSNKFQEAIDRMVTVLAGSGKIDLSVINGGRVLFNQEAAGSERAFTQAQKAASNTPQPSRINIRPAAFTEQSITVLYAVIIHEFQHALQFIGSNQSLVPGQATDNQTNKQRDVEAHAKVIINSRESGVFDSPAVMEEMWDLLVRNWNGLLTDNRRPFQRLFNQAKAIAIRAIPRERFQNIVIH